MAPPGPCARTDGPVGDADVEAGRETGEGVADECVRGESTGDDAREGLAPLGGRAEREAAAEDGDEGEDAEPAVALNADGSGELRLSGCKRDLESGGERGVGAEVERVRASWRPARAGEGDRW